MKRYLVFIIPMLFSSGAFAGYEWDYAAPSKNRCSVGGQQDMNKCLADEYIKTDAKLNELYRKLIESLEDPEKLRNAQRAWIIFRDLSCEYSSSGIGKEGSLYSYAISACMIDKTEKRIKDLELYIEWGGCNGCPPLKYEIK